MPEITVTCPGCKEELTMDAVLVGQRIACPACGTEFDVALPPPPPPVEKPSIGIKIVRRQAQPQVQPKPAVPVPPPAPAMPLPEVLPTAESNPAQQPAQQKLFVPSASSPAPHGGSALSTPADGTTSVMAPPSAHHSKLAIKKPEVKIATASEAEVAAQKAKSEKARKNLAKRKATDFVAGTIYWIVRAAVIILLLGILGGLLYLYMVPESRAGFAQKLDKYDNKTVLQWAADNGNLRALVKVTHIYEKDGDKEKLRKCREALMDTGHLESILGITDENDYSFVIGALKKNEDPDSYFILGAFYLLGLGTPQNVDEFYNCLKKSGKAGSSEAAAALAELYRIKKGADNKYAVEWAQKLKELGSSPVSEGDDAAKMRRETALYFNKYVKLQVATERISRENQSFDVDEYRAKLKVEADEKYPMVTKGDEVSVRTLIGKKFKGTFEGISREQAVQIGIDRIPKKDLAPEDACRFYTADNNFAKRKYIDAKVSHAQEMFRKGRLKFIKAKIEKEFKEEMSLPFANYLPFFSRVR